MIIDGKGNQVPDPSWRYANEAADPPWAEAEDYETEDELTENEMDLKRTTIVQACKDMAEKYQQICESMQAVYEQLPTPELNEAYQYHRNMAELLRNQAKLWDNYTWAELEDALEVHTCFSDVFDYCRAQAERITGRIK